MCDKHDAIMDALKSTAAKPAPQKEAELAA